MSNCQNLAAAYSYSQPNQCTRHSVSETANCHERLFSSNCAADIQNKVENSQKDHINAKNKGQKSDYMYAV